MTKTVQDTFGNFLKVKNVQKCTYYAKNDGDAPINYAAREGHTEIIKIVSHLTDNPKALDDNGQTPIHLAAANGHTEKVKILTSLTDYPNALDDNGLTPIYWAAADPHIEIVKILATLTVIDRHQSIMQQQMHIQKWSKF